MITSLRALYLKSLFSLVLVVATMILPFCGTPQAAQLPSDAVTQGEFAASLVRGLGWQAGLPAEPKTADYLAVLSGKRTFRFEAEDVYNAQGDSVTLRDYQLYGPFSGAGWLSGIAVPTTVRFTVFLPRGGEYRLKVVSRGDGQRWLAGGKEFTVNAGGKLREVDAGTVLLTAGSQEISVLLPPEGGVDAFTLVASGDHPAIEPLGGWRADASLTWSDYAEAMAVLLDLEKGFAAAPSGKPQIVTFQSAATLPPSSITTSADYLGAHVSPKWVRAGGKGAIIDLPLHVNTTGVYGLRVRLLGARLMADFNGKRSEWDGKPYLNWYDLGISRLTQGTHTLSIQLPPLGGADAVELTARTSSSADYLVAIGLGNKKPTATVQRTELESQLLKDLSRIRPSR